MARPLDFAVVLMLAAAGCGGTIQSATPTSAPTASPGPTEPPTPTPRPTPTPAPTRTFDDQEIAKIIKLTAAGLTDRMTFEGAETDADYVRAFKDIREWADLQKTKIGVFSPSVCTKQAVDLFDGAMDELQELSTAFIDWVAEGAVGDPGTSDMAKDVGAKLATAITQLEAHC